jgi:hypothetical protein
MGLTLSAAALVLWPRATDNRASPQPVAEGDQEVVWLYAATNTAAWERFVTAVDKAVHGLQIAQPGLGLAADTRNAFPAQTTAVPEVAISVKGSRGRLLFRWYKLSSGVKSQDWAKALLQRRPAPLAIIGGSSSDLAIELAHHLKDETDRLSMGAAAPLLLLTAATADDEPSEQPSSPVRPLNSIYAGRTYRFCFTNRQMGEAVTDFVWSQPELRPDMDPVYLAFWEDDPYSVDLSDRFLEALRGQANRAAVRSAIENWAWFAGYQAVGGFPLDLSDVWWGGFRLALYPVSERIFYSVGTFGRPNQWEAKAANRIIEVKLGQHPMQRRPLLVVSAAASQSARRFLRGLVRTAPVEARRFVAVTGDAIPFNTVYRDRNAAWSIQDLPLPLVFFCHRDPTDTAAGFREEGPESTPDSLAGTEDLLLYMDIVDAVVQAGYPAGSGGSTASLPADAGELKERMSQARWWKEEDRVGFSQQGPFLFDDEGHRRSGTGEHVVYLRPMIKGEEVVPAAQIEVWSWQAGSSPSRRRWHRQACLQVRYEGYLEPEVAKE